MIFILFNFWLAWWFLGALPILFLHLKHPVLYASICFGQSTEVFQYELVTSYQCGRTASLQVGKA